MSEFISAIASFLSWYWQVFGFDFLNPYFWLAFMTAEAVLVPVGAIVAYRWGLSSPQSYCMVLLSAIAGVAINLAF